MRARLLVALVLTALAASGAAQLAACSDVSADGAPGTGDGGPTLLRDATPVDVEDASNSLRDAGGSQPPPDCEKYCDQVTKNCTGPEAQYASEEDCLAFCKHLPLGTSGDDDKGTVACRQYFAGNAARTSPAVYCNVAGPFGGGICGDRCTAFCDVALSACSADAGGPQAFKDKGECNTACADFSFQDAGADAGGESPTGPTKGNSLNCRLYYLRQAVKNVQSCVDLKMQSPSCKY